jgi:hypothetical protein
MNRITFPLFAFLFFSKILAAQVDTVPPVIFCKQGIGLPIYPTGMTVAWVPDLIDTLYDNSNTSLQTGIRKVCTGDGFPENKPYVVFFINEYSEQTVEIWARDGAGNAASCFSKVEIFIDQYDPGSGVSIFTLENEGIDSVITFVKGTHCYYDYDSVDYQIPNNFGWWPSGTPGYWMTYAATVPHAGYHFSVTPSKNINPLNGVTTYDLVLISKHILGIEPLDSPFKIIAADANQDGKVTTFDIITLRKLILGITDELPNGKSWRFLPADYNFSNPANPFQTPFPERIESPNTADPAPSFFAFKGIKIGDVDFSADPKQ